MLETTYEGPVILRGSNRYGIIQNMSTLPRANYRETGKNLFINHRLDQSQSSRAIISSFAIGAKLSISRPRAARAERICGGTSFWFKWGAMESSVKWIKIRDFANATGTAYHDERNRKVLVNPSPDHLDDANLEIWCLDLAAHRKMVEP
jgi:hypothetical protein